MFDIASKLSSMLTGPFKNVIRASEHDKIKFLNRKILYFSGYISQFDIYLLSASSRISDSDIFPILLEKYYYELKTSVLGYSCCINYSSLLIFLSY